jgi:dTDP-glucose 4,6-dehydratase
MTIPEACQLVVQAGALSHDGEVLVLDMGEPVKISDLARRLIAESERQIEIVYTGLRPGEKLHELLFSPSEVAFPSEHPLISRVEVPALTPAQAEYQDPFLGPRVIDLRSSTGVSPLADSA